MATNRTATSRCSSTHLGVSSRENTLPTLTVAPAAPGALVLYQRPRIDTTGDPELAAYNAYLAELNEKALGQETPRGR